MMYQVSLVERPDHLVWIPQGQFDPQKHVKHAERPITDSDILDWIDADWPVVEADAEGTTVSRLEPTQSHVNMFRGRNVREALLKAMRTPASAGILPTVFCEMTDEEQLDANS